MNILTKVMTAGTFVLLLTSTATPALAVGDVFFEIEHISDTEPAKGHAGWCDLLSVDISPSMRGTSGSAKHGTVTLKRGIAADKCSKALAAAYKNKSALKNATFDIVNSGGTTRIEMKRVMVTSISSGGSSKTVDIELIAMDFASMSWRQLGSTARATK